MWRERESEDKNFESSFTFSFVVLTHGSSRGSSSRVHVWVGYPYLELTPKWGLQLSGVFTLLWQVFNCCFYIVPSGSQLTLSCFLSCAHCPNGVFVWVPSSQSEHVLDLLPKRFYFQLRHQLLWWCEIPESTFSLSFLSRFSYLFLSFPLSCGGPVNFVKKQLPTNWSPKSFYIPSIWVWVNHWGLILISFWNCW